MRRKSLHQVWRCGTHQVVAAVLLAGLVAAGMFPAPGQRSASAEGAATPASGNPYVKDAVAQLNAIGRRPDAMGWWTSSGIQPTQCKHWQGLARSNGPGPQYLFVSRSGNSSPCPDENDNSGDLSVVRFRSREETGERWRSNRLRRDTDIVDTAPPYIDERVALFPFDGSPVAGQPGAVWPPYYHPGGMQLVGDVLVVALERRKLLSWSPNLIAFIDMKDPMAPKMLSSMDPTPKLGGKSAGLVGVTPLADGRHLMAVTGGDNSVVATFISEPGPGSTPRSLRDRDLSWEPFDQVSESTIESRLDDDDDWPVGGDGHQSLNFVREGPADDQIYLVGGRNTNGGIGGGSDMVDLFRVDLSHGDFRLLRAAERELDTHPNLTDGTLGSGNVASFAPATGTYISPSGELLFYATEHDNTGPPDYAATNSVNMGEWRHTSVVRDDSPTTSPTASAGGTYAATEGGAVQLHGSGAGPITAAWVELFADEEFRGRYAIADYWDWSLDSFDDFDNLDGETWDYSNFSDDPTSVRWFAPQGCTIVLNHEPYEGGEIPGGEKRVLPIARHPAKIEHLGDDDGSISSVTFRSDCDHYYRVPMDLKWDLDGDGVFETDRSDPVVSLAAVDGPGTVSAGLQAQHPVDLRVGRDKASIHVANVAPTVTSMAAFDPTGAQVGVDVPVVLAGLPVRLDASFTDPGTVDTQTASIDWGDGTTEASASFTRFTDASGGAVGDASHVHAFARSGTYDVRLKVVDDDGGATERVITVTVLSPEEALGLVLEKLDSQLATSGAGSKALQAARDAIDGSNGGAAADGALDRLASGDRVAAMEKLAMAIDALYAAEAQGAAGASSLRDLVALAAYAVAADTHQLALAAVSPATAAEQRRLDGSAVDIALGAARLADRDHRGAVAAFTDSVRAAQPMCRC